MAAWATLAVCTHPALSPWPLTSLCCPLLSLVASVAASNVLLAGQSAHAATSAAGKLVGGLLTKSLDAHRNAGRLLVEVVNAINSLNIAGLNVAAGVTNTALSALVGKIRWDLAVARTR